jgi:hypothetical protein
MQFSDVVAVYSLQIFISLFQVLVLIGSPDSIMLFKTLKIFIWSWNFMAVVIFCNCCHGIMTFWKKAWRGPMLLKWLD